MSSVLPETEWHLFDEYREHHFSLEQLVETTSLVLKCRIK